MRYTFRNKNTLKLKNKLKVILTILLAVLVTSTGYILARNAFSSTANYTITFNAGSDGHFEGGGTTNSVSYSIDTGSVTKYSHSPNVDDTGLKNSDYANNESTNDVVTIPGATSLTVDLYYNGEDTSYDWVSVWAGNYPSYSASGNTTSTGYVTTEMGAPNNNNKFGGSQSESYTVNGNSLTNMGHTTLTISGESVTFAFESDSSVCGDGYGYYAIITGTSYQPPTVTSGTYQNPISNGQKAFLNWNTASDGSGASYDDEDEIKEALDTLGTTTLYAQYVVPTTITYDASSNGYFEGGGNTNIVNYAKSPVEYKVPTTKCSHTDNINDQGDNNYQEYENDQETNDIVTIPGATTLTIELYYGGYNEDDYVSVWTGSHPDYGAEDEYDEYEKVTTAEGAPDDENKFGGDFYGESQTINGVTIENIRHCTLTIQGDTVTFSFYSNGHGNYYGYGYYAVISGIELQEPVIVSGTYKEPISKDPEKVFKGWSPEFYSVTSSTTLTAQYDYAHHGIYEGVNWRIDADGTLIIGKSNETQTFTNNPNRTEKSWPWREYREEITGIQFEGKVNGNGSHSGMFNQCSNATSFNQNGFNTENVTDMSYMFYMCSKLPSLNITKFNTSNVTNMQAMFMSCTLIKYLDVSHFDTSKVTDMSNLFDIWNLREIDLSNFDTSKVRDMSRMFEATVYINELDLSSFDTSNVEDMDGMFYMSHVRYLNISSFNTSKVKNMRAMFDAASNLASLDISHFDTSNVENMNMMFARMNLDSLDLSNFNTSNVTDMSSMFWNSNYLKNVDVSSFDTSKVTDMYSMFELCKSLTSLDLSSFNTTKATISCMFRYCNKLKTIKVSDGWVVKNTSNYWVFDSCPSIVGGAGTTYNSSYVDADYAHVDGGESNPGYLTYKSADLAKTSYAVFDSSNGKLNFFKDIIGLYSNGQTDGTKTYYTGFENTTYTASSHTPWYSIRESVTEVSFADVIKPTSTAYWFQGFNNANLTINLGGLNTTNVTTMRGMFQECSTITRLNLSSFKTSNVTDMGSMFYLCQGLTTLDLSKFDTSNVTDMSAMFYSMQGLTSLDLSNFNTSNVEDMAMMFYTCGNITSLDLSNFNTSKVTSMQSMFDWCGNLRQLDITSFNTSNVEGGSGMSGMFAHTNLRNIDLSHFNTSKVTSFSTMFWQCYSLKTVDLTGWDTSKVTSMYMMFSGCNNLTALDLSSFDTSRLSSLDQAFMGCTNLKTIKVSNLWSLGSSTYGDYAFTNCTSIVGGSGTTYDSQHTNEEYAHVDGGSSNPGYLTYKDTNTEEGTYAVYDSSDGTLVFFRDPVGKYTNGQASGTKIYYTGFVDAIYTGSSLPPWYDNRENITSVSFEGKVKPTSTAYWFYGFGNSNLTINLYGLDTSNVTTMKSMFDGCTNLDSLDVSMFDTSKVTNMSSMFRAISEITSLDLSNFDTSKVTNMTAMFEGSWDLTTIDVTSFDTSNVTTMRMMFRMCDALENLDVTGFNTSKVTDMSSMFELNNLVSLDVSNFDTSNVTDMDMMFKGTSIKNLDLSNFNTSKVTDMSSMFMQSYGLLTIDLSSFDTSAVTNMREMFEYCYGLTVLDLSSFDTTSVKYMDYMFLRCDNLTTIKVSNAWNIGGLSYGDSMFASCSNLVGGAGTTFDSSHTDEAYAHIDGGPNNPGYLTYKPNNVVATYAVYDSSDGSIEFIEDPGGTHYNGETDETKTYYTGFINKDFEGQNDVPWNNVRDSITTISFPEEVTPTDTSYWFSGLTNPNVTVDLSNLDTSNVTDMSNMFKGCTNLTTIDLTAADTSEVTDMSGMFRNCSSLTTITVSPSWDVSGVENSSNMFTGATSLVGSKGTTYDANYTDKSRAVIDGGSGSPGYLSVSIFVLTISEEVRGGFANINKEFEFNINIQNNGTGISDTIAYTGSKAGNLTFNNGNATFTLKHGQTIQMEVQANYTYTITQTPDSYTLAKTNDSGTISNDVTATFVDTLDGVTPTGLVLDMLPFIILIIISIFGVSFIYKYK